MSAAGGPGRRLDAGGVMAGPAPAAEVRRRPGPLPLRRKVEAALRRALPYKWKGERWAR